MEHSENFDLELEELKALLDSGDAVSEDQADKEIQEIVNKASPREEKPPVEKKDSAADVSREWQKSILMYLHDIIYLLAGLIVVALLLIRVVVVSGTSMNNTLLDGDFLLVLSNAFYQDPEYGDVVVISKQTFDNGRPIVKRVIATEGQTVDIDFKLGIVYVDGKALDEPYTLTATNTEEGMQFPLTVPEDCIFVLGDNRNVSKDSRSPEIGIVDEQEVLGKVFFLFIPGTNGTDSQGNPRQERDFGRIGVVN